MPVTQVLLGLGSNQDRHRHLTHALDALSQVLGEMRCSPVFESEAVGYQGANFYNLVVAGETSLSLGELNEFLKALEAKNGRSRSDKLRIGLDVDILTFADLVGSFGGVSLPRAEILTNAFVLWPLALLAPQAVHPALKQSYQSLWQQAQIAQKLWPVAFDWHGQALTDAALLGTV